MLGNPTLAVLCDLLLCIKRERESHSKKKKSDHQCFVRNKKNMLGGSLT